MRWTLLVCGTLGCSGDKTTASSGETGDTETEPAGPSTLVLSFDLDPGLIEQMSEPAVGLFEGSVFAENDASALGPNDGATPLLDFTSEALDFGTAGGLLAEKATVGPVDPQIVWILGCLDSDANGCDIGDPITIPNENKFQLTAGEAPYTIKMSLLNPQ